MQKKNINVIVVLLTTFLISNGTFFVLCEKDTILDTINRVGDWTNAILWHSSKAFLFYAAADTFYNIRYIVPKLAYAFAPIKLADKVNGWLGGSSTGELEKHLAQDKYCPLYRDFSMGTYTNVGLPLYNNIWNPFLALWGVKAQNLERVVEETFYNRFKYYPVIPVNENNVLQQQLTNIETSSNNFYQKILDAYNNGAKLFDDVLKLKGQPLHSIEFLSPFLTLDYYNRKLLVHNDNVSIGSNGSEHVTQYLHQLNSTYPHGFVVQTIQLQNFDVDDTDFSNTIDNWYLNVTGVATVPQTNFAAGYRPMAVYECSYEIPVTNIYYLTRNSGDFVLFLKERADEPIEIIIKDDGFFIDGYRGDVTLAYDRALHTLKEQVTQVHGETLAMSTRLTSVIAATVGLLGVATQQIDSINATNLLSEAIINSGIGGDLANVFLNHGQPVPEFLRQYASTSNFQEFSSADFLNTPSPLPNVPDASIPTPYFTYLGTSIAILGVIGVTWYLTKYGMDASPVVESAKTFKESLQDKYVNFK